MRFADCVCEARRPSNGLQSWRKASDGPLNREGARLLSEEGGAWKRGLLHVEAYTYASSVPCSPKLRVFCIGQTRIIANGVRSQTTRDLLCSARTSTLRPSLFLPVVATCASSTYRHCSSLDCGSTTRVSLPIGGAVVSRMWMARQTKGPRAAGV